MRPVFIDDAQLGVSSKRSMPRNNVYKKVRVIKINVYTIFQFIPNVLNE